MSKDRDEARARAFTEAFQAIYLTMHRREGKADRLTGVSRAVLNHLALTGPLTIGEAARHLDRAQSVVSDMVSQLERHGLLERMADPRDRRRTLVWLTPRGMDRLNEERQVLSPDLVARGLARLDPADQDRLLTLMNTVVGRSAPMTTTSCESCGMTIESGPYCEHCVDADGALQPFEERFERMKAWAARRDPAASDEQLETSTLVYMATMPAWADHPRVRAAR